MRTMTYLAIVVGISLFIGFGCGGGEEEFFTSGERIEFNGFSVVPPQGKEWRVDERTDNTLGLIYQNVTSPHTVLATAATISLPEEALTLFESISLEGRREFLEETLRQSETPGRIRVIEVNISPAGALEADCLRYVWIAEDSGVPDYEGSVFTFTTKGQWCLHPDSVLEQIFVWYSQRVPPGQQAAPIDTDGEAFINSFQFSPLE